MTASSPGKSYYEAFQEKLHEGHLKPETLAQIVSVAEEEAFEANKPETAKSFAIHLDSSHSSVKEEVSIEDAVLY